MNELYNSNCRWAKRKDGELGGVKRTEAKQLHASLG